MSLNATVKRVADSVSKSGSKAKVAREVTVEKGSKSGYITSTRYHSNGGEYHEPDKQPHTSLSSVKKYMAMCFGESGDGDD